MPRSSSRPSKSCYGARARTSGSSKRYQAHRVVRGEIDIRPIAAVDSSVVFGGMRLSVSAYGDRVVIKNLPPPFPDTEEIRYEQIANLNLYTGAFFATLTLGAHGGH